MSLITARDETNTLIQSILPDEEGNEQKMGEITNKVILAPWFLITWGLDLEYLEKKTA